MPALRKPVLFKLFEEALRDSGWSFLHLTGPREHPARYQVFNASRNFRVKLYVWNLTFGGRITILDEWRIQITGLPEPSGSQQFIPEIGGKTLIMGWWDDLGIFAAFDIAHHLDPLGKSPSLQIRQGALEAAHVNGMAHHFRGKEEIAFAMRPEFLGAYIENMEDLHACGSSDEALEILSRICEDPGNVDDAEIEIEVPKAREYAVKATKKALRDANFKNRVLTAYGHRCAMCGIQMKLLDAAHILPAAHPDSTDETANGVGLCALHHRAYDRGFITFDTKYRTHCDDDMAREFARLGLDGGLPQFKAALFPVLILPPDKKDRPSALYVERVNAMRGWAV